MTRWNHVRDPRKRLAKWYGVIERALVELDGTDASEEERYFAFAHADDVRAEVVLGEMRELKDEYPALSVFDPDGKSTKKEVGRALHAVQRWIEQADADLWKRDTPNRIGKLKSATARRIGWRVWETPDLTANQLCHWLEKEAGRKITGAAVRKIVSRELAALGCKSDGNGYRFEYVAPWAEESSSELPTRDAASRQ